MPRRIAVFLVLALVFAALFARLGLWQLERLADRRARNAVLATRLGAPIIAFEQLPADATHRRAVIRGNPDHANEIIWTGRSRNGSPGVFIVTPLRRTTSDTAVLVLRGWVYAPDAATVDASRWRENRREYSGYVAALPRGASTAIHSRADDRRVRALNVESVAALMPYPVAPFYVVARDTTAGVAPVRLPMLALHEGPHLGYAIQWFAFAAIAVIGAGAVVTRAHQPRRDGSTNAEADAQSTLQKQSRS